MRKKRTHKSSPPLPSPINKNKMKKIYKYPTGAEIPKGAVYLNTVTQTQYKDEDEGRWFNCWLVWHYFLVEVKDKQNAQETKI